MNEKGINTYKTKIALLTDINIDLQQRIDKAIEYNEHLIRDAKYHLNLGHLKKMKKILLGDKKVNNNDFRIIPPEVLKDDNYYETLDCGDRE